MFGLSVNTVAQVLSWSSQVAEGFRESESRRQKWAEALLKLEPSPPVEVYSHLAGQRSPPAQPPSRRRPSKRLSKPPRSSALGSCGVEEHMQIASTTATDGRAFSMRRIQARLCGRMLPETSPLDKLDRPTFRGRMSAEYSGVQPSRFTQSIFAAPTSW